MAAKLLKHFGIGGSKKVSDQPSQGGEFLPGKGTTPAAAPASTGSVQELRSTSPSKANRASAASFVTSNSWLGSGVGPDIGGPGAPGGPGTDGRRHSDASTIRSFRSRVPGHPRTDLSFRLGAARAMTGTRRDMGCDGGGLGERNPCAERMTEGLAPAMEVEPIKATPQLATEYSDPFDLKQQNRNDTDTKSDVKAWSSEDDYSVPYEVPTDNVAEPKSLEIVAKKLPSTKPEPCSVPEEEASATESPSAAVVPEGSVKVENVTAASELEGDAIVESDGTQPEVPEPKSENNLDFDGGGPDISASGDSLKPPAGVLADPSAGMYDAPWDLWSTQKNLEEKLLKASLTPPPPAATDSSAPDFGLKDAKITKTVAEQDESVAMQIYDEPWDKRAENLHQSFLLAEAGRECDFRAALPDPNQRFRSMMSDPNCTHWPEQHSFRTKSFKGAGEQQKARSGVRTGISSCYPFHSSYCALHTENSLKSRHHHDYRHSTFQHRYDVVDENLPLEKQSWYHGAISRVDAESLLRFHREGSYLVRMSESDRRDYSLSVKSNSGDFMHMKIVRHDAGYILGQFSQPFTSIPQMILYYTINKLPIRGTEHMTLSFPICSELLL